MKGEAGADAQMDWMLSSCPLTHFSRSLSPSLNVCWLFSGPWRGLKDTGEGARQDGSEWELLSLFVFIYLLAQICLSSRLPPVSELLSSVPLNCHACRNGYTCVYAFCVHICLSAAKNLYILLLKIGRTASLTFTMYLMSPMWKGLTISARHASKAWH